MVLKYRYKIIRGDDTIKHILNHSNWEVNIKWIIQQHLKLKEARA